MKIRFYADETISVDLSAILAGLKELAPSYAWAIGNVPFRIIKPPISNPKTYQTLDDKLRTEIKNDDFAFLFTELKFPVFQKTRPRDKQERLNQDAKNVL